MRVVRLVDEPDWKSLLSPIEEIFFATSPSAKTLRPDERQPFRERWLGRYIAHDIESFFVAITEVSTVAGYLAGCLNNPARNPRFADIGYYASFAPLCDRYPCHLHINLDEGYRNRGIGSALIVVCRAGRERGTFGHPCRHRRAGTQRPFL
jgi:GNAT superfamily N-acetyltransferase